MTAEASSTRAWAAGRALCIGTLALLFTHIERTPSWRELARFGSNDVLVNYLWPTAWGDPAFSIKILR